MLPLRARRLSSGHRCRSLESERRAVSARQSSLAHAKRRPPSLHRSRANRPDGPANLPCLILTRFRRPPAASSAPLEETPMTRCTTVRRTFTRGATASSLSATVFAALLATLALVACQKRPAEPPKPEAQQAPAMPIPNPGSTVDSSLPSAASVLPPASDAPRAATPAGRTNRTMSASQESTAMPLPGQANDHSAPMAPAASSSWGHGSR